MTETRRLRYPSDLTQAQWQRLQDILPPAPTVGRHRTIDLRAVADAINYRWETGCVWRMLPHDFPPWGTVYAYFRSWQRAGVIRQFREILLEPRPKTTPRFQPSATAETTHRFHSPDSHGFSSPHDRSVSNSSSDQPSKPLSERQGM